MDKEASITANAYDKLILLCEAALPLEACGLLVCADNTGIADTIIPIHNVHEQPRQTFTFDPQQWIEAYFYIRKNRQKLVGIYHSHPAEPAEPSSSDYEGYLPAEDVAYWIVAFPRQAKPVVKRYRSDGGMFIPIPLVLA
ncbi:M67 family metallopeptidase [Paenibacillus sp. J5C_2022]|uniref:M67 family metallopeptidase n=1 Tax=Paenibacillus sp. J5C2022 TaxID=2977129 RepID=UPI0021D17F05|nr:M67 family metallopeptidase [Paenibacillus sp. J5C2022]MCU6707618.1 M67 family metallopeptidase [Paenibacillus sp. J5C2022]